MIMILLAGIFAIIIAAGLTPMTIKKLKERKLYTKDMHKPGQPQVLKEGGVIILFGIVVALLLIIGIKTFSGEIISSALLASVISILIAGQMGILDDILDFSRLVKVFIPFTAAIPLMALKAGKTTMQLPFIGIIDLGIIYPLIIVPLIITFVIDSTNMLAGMNGLESGLAIINGVGILILAIIKGYNDAAIVAATLIGSTLVFFKYNKYPAKLLPGDVGRLPLGATMATAIILGNMERFAIFLFLLYFINFVLFIALTIKVKRANIPWPKFARVNEDGTLTAPGPFTVYWILPYFKKGITEKQNVYAIMLIQAIIVIIGLIISCI